MKRIKFSIKIIAMILLVLPIVFLLSACGEEDDSLQTFTDVVFLDKTVDYDGQEHEIIISGELPTGVSIVYGNNKGINAGVYNAKVTISMEGYKKLVLTAKLTINKINYDMSRAHWDYESAYTYNGNEHSVMVVGLPQGVTVKQYRNNKKIEAGTYTASAVLNYDTTNYNAVSIEDCVWKILPNVSQVALNVLNSIMNVPDPWEFLPKSFALENRAYSGNTEIDFTNFVNVSSLPQKAIGKQMNVVYSTLIDVDNILDCLRYVYGSFNAIVNLYQTFINSNPENYSSYETTTDNFTFKIVLDNSDYQMYVSYASTALELSFKQQTQKCYGRIQLSNSNVLKYEMSNNELTLAVNILGVYLTELHFERNNGKVSGYLYEYYGTETTNIKTAALIKVDNDYTTIISNKGETDDLIIEGYMEVYKNSTGNLVGSEVKETVKNIKYETSWFNIWDVSNINTIKAIHESNGTNMDTIYINGSNTPIKTKLVGGLTLKTASRRFDIEMKDMFLYTYNKDEQKYEKVKVSLPMLFVQNDYISSFDTDFYTANATTGATSPTKISLNSADKNFMFSKYLSLIDEYLVLKENLTYQSIIDYIGNKNEYFN